ncbi:hypothetical protein ACFL1Q_02525 [Patescibacteria group bacterium]
MHKTSFNKTAMFLLIIPLGFLALFTVGELFSGDISGLSHLIQAAPIIFLIYLSSKKPIIGGLLFITISLTLGIWYALSVPFNLLTILLVETLLFVPPLISGILLITSLRKK